MAALILVPASVAFYWSDPVNGAAINVLAGSSEVPGDLSLAEAGRFELASLAARRVRVEYWGMLRALWSATWEPAVRRHLPAARLLAYGGHRSFTNTDPLADPSVDHAWIERSVAGIFDFGEHGRLFTSVGLVEHEREGELRFYLIDAGESCAITDDLELGPDWGDDGDSRRRTRAGAVPINKGDGRIDPEPFANFAVGAVQALATAVLVGSAP